MGERAQLHPNDELGWLVDRIAEPDGARNLCPKACARAKAALRTERANMATAAERDRALCRELDEYRDALLLARDALDRLMGESDLDDDDSIEMRTMRAIARALERGEGAER